MPVPNQVRDQGARADAFFAQLSNPNPSAPVSDPPQATPEDQGLTPAPAEPDYKAMYLDLERRFKVVQGKLNAEGPRYAARIRELEAQVAELRTSLPAAPQGSPATDLNEFDPALAAALKSVVATEVAPLKQEVEASRQRTKEEQAKAEHQENWNALLDKLDVLEPGWQQLEKEPAYQLWCAEIDPATGKQRQEEVMEAAQRYDAADIAMYYRRYRATHPAAAAKLPDTRLAEKQVPDPSGRSAPPAASAKTYTKDEVNAFYSAKARGALKHLTAAEIVAIEADIVAAFRDRRIIG